MDCNCDTSKLPKVLVNKAIPQPAFKGMTSPSDFFGTYSLSDKSFQTELSDSKEIFSNIYKKTCWEENLGAKNYNFHRFMAHKKVITEAPNTQISIVPIAPIMRPQTHNYGMLNFILIVLIFCAILLAWVRYSFSKYLNQISNSLFNYSETGKLYRDHNTMIDRVYFILNLVFIFTGGLLIYHLLNGRINSGLVNSTFGLYGISCLVLLVLFLSKYIINKSSGYILHQMRTFDEYQHSLFLYYKAMGMVLLPLTAILSFINPAYFNIVLYVSIGAISILYAVSIFRATKIMLQKGVLLFYWILYLCTIEFLPLLLLFKFIRTHYISL